MMPIIENDKFVYRKLLARKEIPLEEILWAYLQIESGAGHMCCGEYDYKIYRVIVRLSSGEDIPFMFEKEAPAKELLELLRNASDRICIGFTEENKKRFLNA